MKTLGGEPGFSPGFQFVRGRFKPGKMHGSPGDKLKYVVTFFS
jgi:hypothetical protein